MTKNPIHLFFLIFLLGSILACSSQKIKEVESGVSVDLAKKRSEQISNILYQISFDIPNKLTEKITGRVTINFDLAHTEEPVILDFRESVNSIITVKSNDKTIEYEFKNEHILISDIQKGKNSIKIEFIAGETSLNRNTDFLYSLFVPDRASTAFPCFDQPDMKAQYELQLSVPLDWVAVSNAPLVDSTQQANSKQYQFDKTEKISTYLFSFVAGKFQTVTQQKNDRSITLYHRETDSVKINESLAPIFDLHFNTLEWQENYTNIKMPFKKLDIIAIPSFQYGGMEHVGAILYRASRLFLDKSATQKQQYGRASVISHEVSHLWFGDYVTMQWFDDVWLKEVFANFFAAKITNPNFPALNHDLSFFSHHYPNAYKVDRSLGANPIQQKLDNLKLAGTMYGNIIYYKAPIVMSKLECIIGEENLQKGICEYLNRYAYGNATWDNLIAILDNLTNYDLAKWSEIWIKEDGMPTISIQTTLTENGIYSQVSLFQSDPLKKNRLWEQPFEVLYVRNDIEKRFHVQLDSTQQSITPLLGLPEADFLLINGNAHGYGNIVLDEKSQKYFLKNAFQISNPLTRGIIYSALYEAVMNKKLTAMDFIKASDTFILEENEIQNIQLLLDNFRSVYWHFLSQTERLSIIESLESRLIEKISKSLSQSKKRNYYNAFISIYQSRKQHDALFKVWKFETDFYGLQLNSDNYTSLAMEMAMRNYPPESGVLHIQIDRIENLDKKEKLRFLMPTMSKDTVVRDQFFASLASPENRTHEPWVNTAMKCLNHPLRSQHATKYILPALDMLEEIQETGDIFFPHNWLSSLFFGHQSPEAASVVNDFLNQNPNYNPALRLKILQTSDLLIRAN